ALEALERLKKGEKFSTVAAQMSIDPNAGNGGYVGEAEVASLRPELRAAVESLQPEQVSGIVRVPTGFVILKLLSRKQEPKAQSKTLAPASADQGATGQGMGPNRDLHLAGKGAIQYPVDVAGSVTQLTEALGVAYLHKSEMANDVYRNPVDRCTFPPRANLCYQQTGDSEKAINYFSKYLELVPERPDAVQVKWLLNLAYMTLGKYPDGVPQKYLISPSVFAAKENFGRFMDAAPAAGLNFISMAGGVVADDFENNGLLDVADRK